MPTSPVSASSGIKSLFKSLLCGKKSQKKKTSKEKKPAEPIEKPEKLSKKSLIVRGYNKKVEKLRKKEYSHLKDDVYLDHSGATIYSTALIKDYKNTLVTNVFGNPHSSNPSSQHSSNCVEKARAEVLEFFNANPDEYDVVFTANATASMKMVADGFVGAGEVGNEGFEYKFHKDAHTSLIGVRELAAKSRQMDDAAVEEWLSQEPREKNDTDVPGLFAWPAQSNFSGRRLPTAEWAHKLREVHSNYYSFIDAAAYAMTSPIDLSQIQPDFMCVSFYKIFGYPDLGALLVRRESAPILRNRRYFGGGTINGLLGDEQFHEKKSEGFGAHPHDYLEDGTIPFHSIVALSLAIKEHKRIYSNPKQDKTAMQTISQHTYALGSYLHDQIGALRYPASGTPLMSLYTSRPAPPKPTTPPSPTSAYFPPHPAVRSLSRTITRTEPLEEPVDPPQAALLTFNLHYPSGSHIPFSMVEASASKRRIHVRSGRHCNIGGVQYYLSIPSDMLKRAYEEGLRCGADEEMDEIEGRPLGAVRVSIGACTTLADVEALIKWLKKEYLSREEALKDEEREVKEKKEKEHRRRMAEIERCHAPGRQESESGFGGSCEGGDTRRGSGCGTEGLFVAL
ncbi:PLP-dependent transferase [Ascobolus immersus RN42]|uniref:PLP-dependent transferase n=1 Tax=Ascobolus immersus RN42 TaxID=1160509 RepID=A0A3N4HM41_ASCIM|nr:PLP-dependent transferase [Ascobolus immersus RN42]